jgi:dynein heavy chain
MPKVPWMNEAAWDDITELEKILPETFTGLSTAISHSPQEWKRWHSSSKPEKTPLPAEWETKCEERLKKMIILRCLRKDRLMFACSDFIEEKMKKEFVEIKSTTLKDVYEDSGPTDPIMFIL